MLRQKGTLEVKRNKIKRLESRFSISHRYLSKRYIMDWVKFFLTNKKILGR